MIRTNRLILLAASAIFSTANAYAADPAPEPAAVRISVAYGDLDLDKPTDARILFMRLENAAKRACGPAPFMQPLYGVIPEGLKQTYKECIAGAVGDAVARLDAPLVSRIYAETRDKKPSNVASR